MYIDENRPNIKVICNKETYHVHLPYRDKKSDGLSTTNLQGNSIPSPIVIANPLPPFFMGHSGQTPPLMPDPTQQAVQETGVSSIEAGSPPLNQPPSFTPTKKMESAIHGDGDHLMVCLYHFVYVWPKQQHPGYWFYLTNVTQNEMMGYMWTGYRYLFKVIEINSIETYQCY
ncbi:MAG TPA: hypothetical protein DCY20_00415 [Firmicutes bacterium]|nr:hypothetical protein [Bacillota bacterium]